LWLVWLVRVFRELSIGGSLGVLPALRLRCERAKEEKSYEEE
jgi:hypothetical protein